jgi:hypothetical protein
VLPDVALPNGLRTPKDLCFEHANDLISASCRYRTRFSFNYNSGLKIAEPYVTAFTLLPQLGGNTRVAEPFAKACQYLRDFVPNLDLLRYSLRSLEALALLHKVRIPPNALQYFQDLDIDDGVLGNVPITLLTAELPPNQTPDTSSSSSQNVDKVKLKIEAESMRELLARWNDLTVRALSSSGQSAS